MSEITQPTASSESIPDVDIAVVGAGVAGCYTAWRLQTLAKEQLAAGSLLLPLFDGKDRLNVALFEYSDRIGGRLWSVALNGIPEEFAEFGGMRFYKQMHIVWNLIEKLGLASRAIPFPVGEPQNVVYVRGQHLRKGDLAARSGQAPKPEGSRRLRREGLTAKAHHALPYKLRYLEEGKSADELIDFVCETTIEGFSKLRKDYAAAFDAQDWETVRQIRDQYEARKGQAKISDRTVYEMSWWELQTFLLSNEAFRLAMMSPTPTAMRRTASTSCSTVRIPGNFTGSAADSRSCRTGCMRNSTNRAASPICCTGCCGSTRSIRMPKAAPMICCCTSVSTHRTPFLKRLQKR